MGRKLMSGMVARAPEQPIIILKSPKGTFHAPWDAAKVITAMRATLPSDQLHLDIVVIDGEPNQNPKLFGSSKESSDFVRSILAKIADPNYVWTPISVDC